MQNKKIGGVFLGYVLAGACGYLSRGRGVKVLELRRSGNYFKSLYLLCILISIGGLGLLFYILGCGGVLGFYCLTLLGVGYLLFPKT
jgi:hypothetical protein